MLHKTTKKETKIAVFAAIDNDNAEMLTLLLEKGASLDITNENKEKPFAYSAKKNKFKCLKVIVDVLEKQHIERQQNTEALFAAIEDDDLAGVEILLTKPLDLSFKNKEGVTPIVYAAENAHWTCVSEIAKAYEAKKGDPGGYGSAALTAARDKRYDIVELLLSGPISLTWYYFESMNRLCHYAASHNQPKILRQLIEKGARVTDKNAEKMTAIHLAATLDHWDCVAVILDCSASDSIDAQFGAALYHAVVAKRLDITTRFLDKWVVSWERASDKANILEIAVEQNYPKMVELLTQIKYRGLFNDRSRLLSKLLPLAKPECGYYIAGAIATIDSPKEYTSALVLFILRYEVPIEIPKTIRLRLINHIFTLAEDERKTVLMQALDDNTSLHNYLLNFEQTFTERLFTQKEISADTFEARIKTELKRLKDIEKQTSELKTASVYADDTFQDLSAMLLLSAESKSESQSKQPITATLTPVYLSTQTWASQFPSVSKEKPKKIPKKQDEARKEIAQGPLM